MKQIELKWNGILDFKELITHEVELKGKPGIYIWGWLDEENNFVPYYVGKANNLAQRLFEHIGKLKGGLYSIYSWKYARSKDFAPLLQKDGDKLLYVPSNIGNWKNNFLDSTVVQKNLNLLIENLKFSWCLTEKKYNNDLERSIFVLLSNTDKVGASVKGKPKEDIKIKFSGEEALVRLCQQNQ